MAASELREQKHTVVELKQILEHLHIGALQNIGCLTDKPQVFNGCMKKGKLNYEKRHEDSSDSVERQITHNAS